jgi:hypothetical protein
MTDELMTPRARPSVYQNPNGFPLSDGKTLHMEVSNASHRRDIKFYKRDNKCMPNLLNLPFVVYSVVVGISQIE